MKKIYFLLAVIALSATELSAQIEDRADYEYDIDEDPQMVDEEAPVAATLSASEKRRIQLYEMEYERLKEATRLTRQQREVPPTPSEAVPNTTVNSSVTTATAQPSVPEAAVSDEPWHLKFMNTELDGTIEQFHQKMQEKGLTLSPESKSLPVGLRLYEGQFSGEKASIYVYYNKRSLVVYRAKAVISRHGKEAVMQLLANMRMKLDIKYGSLCRRSDYERDENGHDAFQYLYMLDTGTIGLYISSTTPSKYDQFFLHIDYRDYDNEQNNLGDELDDL